MNFNNKFDKYDDNAHVQKTVASNLIKFSLDNSPTPNKTYDTIFEVGCGTGILSRKLVDNFKLNKLILNDKFEECRSKILDLSHHKFIAGSIENVDIPKSNMIISSSVFQWIEDKDLLFKTLSQKTNKLIFSIYIEGNLIEISNHFGVSLKYNSVGELNTILNKYFKDIKYYNEDIVLNFETPLKALKHLKNTGVTGISQNNNIKKIKEYKEKNLTYKVAYFICKN